MSTESSPYLSPYDESDHHGYVEGHFQNVGVTAGGHRLARLQSHTPGRETIVDRLFVSQRRTGTALSDFHELGRGGAANGAPLGRHAELDVAAEGAQVEARFGHVFALRNRIERRLVQPGVYGFGL